ncbi:hypothetical protein [Cognatiyoonia sp. IB215182]|uniref:hypothetical protein n=1 Tax=Cognatiyoonia sp. IB215182 TaxID=3097353 RepID=UPI002A161320|nr:hypothetical protein [Cognatiyoonia sp. IB215182]MDX8355383.1 hypothetical protein [Cognatiyoonia sp. IB215182]
MALMIVLTPIGVQACTTSQMLEFIGSLEAPEGYNQVYSGVKLMPPAPITSMTVQEVINWQREASRTAVSSAAGRYQVIRATLESLVAQGVVRPSDRFSPRTQDRLGAALLADIGYTNGTTDPNVANRISGVWAALPRVTGPGRGVSTYEGIAGNHALIDPDSYMAFMACEIGLSEIRTRSAIVRAGLRVGLSIEALLENIREQSARIVDRYSQVAIWLLWSLLAVQLVFMFGRLAIMGEGLEAMIASMVFLLPLTLLLWVVITNFGDILTWTARAATQVSNDTIGSEGFSLATLIRDRMILFSRNMEAGYALSTWVYGGVLAATLCNLIVLALQLGAVIFVYMRSLIVLAASAILLGLGSLSGTQHVAFGVLAKLLGAFLQILTITIILFATLDLTRDLSAASGILGRAFAALTLDLVALVLLVAVPRTMTKLAVVRGVSA